MTRSILVKHVSMILPQRKGRRRQFNSKLVLEIRGRRRFGSQLGTRQWQLITLVPVDKSKKQQGSTEVHLRFRVEDKAAHRTYYSALCRNQY
jgi:hypothetical protein